jgi:hypothetical protein
MPNPTRIAEMIVFASRTARLTANVGPCTGRRTGQPRARCR